MKILVDEVKTRCCGQWVSILSPLMPAGTPLNGKHGPCPFCGGKDRFRFDDKNGSGSWFCNQCGSGDGIEAYKRLTNGTFLEVLEFLQGSTKTARKENFLPASKTELTAPKTELIPTVPAPDPLPLALRHQVLGEPVSTWRYYTPSGELMALVARYEKPDKKIFTPWLYHDGKWVSKAWPAPRPLYNLHLLAKYPRLPVILFEGEKTADAGTALFKGAVCTTGMNGSSFYASHDITPLQDRHVILVPDADKPGLKYMTEMESRLKGIATKTIIIKLPETLTITESGGWDIADGGPPLETVLKRINDALKAVKAKTPLYLEADIESRVQAIFEGIGRYCGLYVWGELLVRLADVRGVKQIQEIDAQRLQVFLSERFKFFMKDSTGEWTPKTLPLQMCNYILAKSPENWPFPAIERVIRAPVYGTNKELALKSGFHESVAAWLELGNLKLEIPNIPTEMDLEEAVYTIQDAVADFPFQDNASFANTVALMLLPFVRMLIDGPTPLHLISAPVQGTGKSMLAELVALVATGQGANIMTEGGDDAEWRKKITSTLLRSPTIVILDNINKKMDSGALASVLTSRIMEDRLLGSSKTLQIPNDAVWVATANKPTMTGELARRVIWIGLNPNTESPWNRDGFRHDPLIPWVRENRDMLLKACLIIIQNWIAQGAKPGSVVLGSFEVWAKTMSGILSTAGINHFMENASALYDAANEEVTEWRDFVEKWHAIHGQVPVGIADLFEIIDANGFFELVRGDGNERSQKIRIGMLLKQNVDRVYGQWRIQRAPKTRNGTVFLLYTGKTISTISTPA